MTDRDLPENLPLATPDSVEVDLWNRDDSRSLLNLLSPAVQASVIDAAKMRPELFSLDERGLFRKLRSDNCSPTPTDNRLRIQFWMEYDRANTEFRKMKMEAIFAGVCHTHYFYHSFLKSPAKVSWMLMPPVEYTNKIQEALDYGLDRLRDYLSLDPESGGKLNIKLMELQARIVAMLDQRVKGGIVQRVEQKNMNLNVLTSDKQVAAAVTGATMEQLNRRIKELNKMEKKAMNLPTGKTEVVDVESE